MTPSDLLANDVPLIDLRAPAEFARGAFPNAVNRPLLTDDERAEIGTLHKRSGRDAAMRRGHELVAGEVRDARHQELDGFSRPASGGSDLLLARRTALRHCAVLAA
ncbi:MAG: hypothetical protein OXG51_15660 [Gammaproteobacteria bacterium]|nr:hypothetical protein [Gammaproteobacteria bacterium]